MTQGWRLTALLIWYALVVAPTIQDLLENHKSKKHWRESHGNTHVVHHGIRQ